uniref:Uncharacterized protein n=1 Tax=Tanacetum cinerariifolium TaxID=118510 RepID=A0A699VJ12_TANCI|nr:hypothetical protein [Tanacetum cinerariifolium]
MNNETFTRHERMMIRKDPPLDQTGGLKDKKKEVSMHQLALYLKQQPGVQADLPQGWSNLHIRCLKQVPTINQLFEHLSILNGFPSQGNHLHWIVTGTNLCQLLKEMLNRG